MDEERAAIVRLKQGDIAGLEGLVRQYQVVAVHTAYLIIGERPSTLTSPSGGHNETLPATSAFDPFPFFVSSPAELVVNEAVQIGAQPGKYLVEVDGHTGLIWAQDGHKMMLETSWSPTYGARLEKEVLLAVAENLHAAVGNR